MAISLAVAFIGSVMAAVGTGVLTARCFRAPRADVISITLAIFGLTVALGALSLGNLAGFGPITFRAMELSGQVLSPLALCLGMAEMAAQTVAVRFAARLILSAVAVVAFVILSTDQLNPAVPFSKAWPAASVYYETIPNDLLRYGVAPVATLTALIAIGVAAVRLVRHPAWQPAAAATGSAAVAALALAVPAAVRLPSGAVFAVLFLAAAGLTWLAGAQGGKLRHDVLNGSFADEDDDGWDQQDSWGGHADQTGDFDAVANGGEGLYRGNGLYRPEDGDSASAYRQHDDGYERDGRDAGYLGDDYGREEIGGAYDGEYAGGHESGNGDANYAASDNGTGGAARSGAWRSADRPGEPDHLAAAGIPAGDLEARARLFGQIAIYTLLEDRVEEFDQLTEQVVEQVRAREPDTLVYIVHAVPSAPMQRILYEVYRDRAAYDEHRRQPYVARFELERRPYVLATNVIELGLQQAKVSPLPSISDLLGPSGPGSPDFIPPAPGRQPGPGHSGHSQPGHSQPGHSQPGHGLAGHDEAGHSEPGYSPSGSSPSGYDEPPYNETPYETPYNETPHAESRYAEPGYSPSGYSPSRYDQPRYEQPGLDAPYDEAPHDEPGYDEPGYHEPGYHEPGYHEPGYGEPGYGQPGYGESQPGGPTGRDEGPQRQW